VPFSRLLFPHGLPLQVDSMAVVEQAVADAFRRAGLPNHFTPLANRDSAGHDNSALEVALLDDIEQDLLLLGLEDIDT
jgi:hypothetical protein